MKKHILVLFLFQLSFTFSQSLFHQFIDHVNSLSDPVARQAAVDSFMTYARTN